jgi:hypothetical protein
VSGTRTVWRTATAEVSGGVSSADRSCSGTGGWAAMAAGHRPCSSSLRRPWSAVAAVPDRCPSRELPCPRWLPQGPSSVYADGRRAVGGRTPVRARDRRRHRPGHACRTLAVRTAVVPEAADGQSADGSPLMVPARYNFLYCSSRPALRAAASGGRPRAGSAHRSANRPMYCWI